MKIAVVVLSLLLCTAVVTIIVMEETQKHRGSTAANSSSGPRPAETQESTVVSTPSPATTSPSAEDQLMNYKEINGRRVAKWVERTFAGESRMNLYSDHTGTASGFCFYPGADFRWRLEGRKVLFSDWKSSKVPPSHGEINSDGTALNVYDKDGSATFLSRDE